MATKERNAPTNEDFEVKFNDFRVAFGRRIKYYRDLKNYTQEYLAELVNIEQSSLSNIERGRVHPSPETLYRLANALDVKPYQFYTASPEIPVQDAVKEIAQAMYQDKKLAELMYKFFLAVQ